MQTVISVLSGFFIVQMIFGLLFAQMQLESGAFRLFFDEAGTVPMTLLSIGQWIQAAALVLVVAFLSHTEPRRLLFPRFVGSGINADDMEAPGLGLIWEWISVALVLFLPLIGIAYWWVAFLDTDRGAWVKATNEVVATFDRVPGCHFFGSWDVCRYGYLPPGQDKGDSFVPFWQPVLVMGGGTIIVCILTLWVLRIVFRRAPLRRAEVARLTEHSK